MRHIILICFSLFIFLYAQSQESKIDSLKGVLSSTSSQELKLSTLENLNKILISKSSLKNALPYFIEMSEIANELGNDELESRAYKYSSEVFMKEMDSVKAISYAKQALSISEKNQNLNLYLIDINQLGRVYHHFQLYEKAIETYNLGISKYNKNKDESCLVSLARIYSNSSSSYDKLGRTDESIEAVLKGVEIAEKTNSNDQKSYGLYILGYKYMGLKNYKKAEEYFLKSLTFSDSVSLHTFINMNHHGLGINYSRWGKYDKALYHNKVALDFYKKQGNKLYEFDVLNNTAVVYQRMNIPDSVVKYGNLALKIAEEINHKQAIRGAKNTLANAYINLSRYSEAEQILTDIAKDTLNSLIFDNQGKASLYSNLSEVYEGQNKYKKSLKFHKKFKVLNDSIEKEVRESKFAELETRYRNEENEKEIANLRADNAEKDAQNTRLFFSLFLSLIIVTVLVIFVYYRRKKTKETEYKYQKELDELKQEKADYRDLIANQDTTINNLEKTVAEKQEFISLQLSEKENSFHNDVLKTNYNLTKGDLEYWIDQSKGLTEEQMSSKYSVAKSTIESKGKRLRSKIKLKKGIDSKISLGKEEMLRIYKEEWKKFHK